MKFLKKYLNDFNNTFFYGCIIFIIGFGVFLRTKYYLDVSPLWWDEITLAHSFFDRNFFEMFTKLDLSQKAPALWCGFVWFITKIGGYNELSFRFISYFVSILSIFAFYKFSKIMFNGKFAILISTYLFCTSLPLIYYAQEFKPYETDVLVFLILLLSYRGISFKNISNKKIFIYTLLSGLIILFSSPSAFILPAIFILKIIEEKAFSKKLLFLPFGMLSAMTYIYMLYKDMWEFEITHEEWIQGFLTLSFESINSIFENYVNFLQFNNSSSIWLIVFVFGLILLIMEKKKETFVIIITLFFLLCASYLKIYPLTGRMILFLVPVFIVFVCKLIDTQKSDKIITREKEYILSILICIFLFFTKDANIKDANIVSLHETNYRVPKAERVDYEEIHNYFSNNYENNERLYFDPEFLDFNSFYYKTKKSKIDTPQIQYESLNYSNKERTLEILSSLFNDLNENNISFWIGYKMYDNFEKPDYIDIYINNKNKNLTYKIDKKNTSNTNLFHIYKEDSKQN